MKNTKFVELDIVRSWSAIWIIGCHLWVIYLLPHSLGYSEYQVGMGIHAFHIDHLGWQQFFPLPFNTFGNVIFDFMNIFWGLGYQGVHIFFFLSGFGLTCSRILKPNQNWITFFKKRFYRIYPSVWVLSIFILLADYIKTSEIDIVKYLRSFILLDNVVPASWFLFPLLQFYVAFPFSFKLLQKFSIAKFIKIAFFIKIIYTLLILVLGYLLFNTLIGEAVNPGYLAVSRLFEFCLGMAAGKIYIKDTERLVSCLVNPKILCMAIISEVVGTICSWSFIRLDLMNHRIPIGISLSDALIGFGVVVIAFNVSRIIINFTYIKNLLLSIDKYSYELYITQFISLKIISSLLPFIIPANSPIPTMIFSIPILIFTIGIGIISAKILQIMTNWMTDKLKIKKILSI